MSSSLVTRHSSLKYWAVVPAAGVGKRMRADRPKQYLEIEGRSLLEHAEQLGFGNDDNSAIIESFRDPPKPE